VAVIVINRHFLSETLILINFDHFICVTFFILKNSKKTIIDGNDSAEKNWNFKARERRVC